jgi:hypothetical protein
LDEKQTNKQTKRKKKKKNENENEKGTDDDATQRRRERGRHTRGRVAPAGADEPVRRAGLATAAAPFVLQPSLVDPPLPLAGRPGVSHAAAAHCT